mmetsp:Transcript_23957/g.50144  ORF Transcript_23957/g.50144 Transcript_23957/m.50144 type:complete len:216 (+) Transcript_23957:84-731(+)
MSKHTNKPLPLDLTITGRKCRIHRNDHVARSLEDGANLMDLLQEETSTSRTKDNDWNRNSDDATSRSLSVSSKVMVDRYDARSLLDEFSLGEAILHNRHNIMNIDVGIDATLSPGYASQPTDEVGNKEELVTWNYERFGALAEYSSCFVKGETNEGEEKLAFRKSSSTSDDHADASTQHAKTNAPDDTEDAPFELSEKVLQGLPSDAPLVSEIYI